MNDIDNLLTAIRGNRTCNSCSISGGSYVDIDLSNLRANKLYIENISLLSANLTKVNWRSCEIVNVCLDKANFDGAIIRLCKFANLSAKKASFNNAIIENCDLVGCDFKESNFMDSSITDSDFSRSNFVDSDLTNTNASYCNMRGADFRRAILINTDFSDADLRGVDFSGAKLENAKFINADLRGAIFDPGVMDEAPTEEAAAFSPQIQKMVDAVGPYVAGILKAGVSENIVPISEQDKLMRQLENMLKVSVGTEPENKAKSDFVELLLKHAGEAGIGNLIESLHSKNDKPSEAVADLIQNLATDLNLNEDDTTEDLLEKLIKSVK